MSHSVISRFNARFEQAGPYAKAVLADGVFCCVLFAGYFLTCHPPHDAFGYILGRDFANMWMGAHAAWSGNWLQLFDVHQYVAALHHQYGTMPAQNWSYPPSVFLLIWPMRFLHYFGALAAWSLLGIILCSVVSRPKSLTSAGLILLSPAVIMNLLVGQNGLYSAAVLIATLKLLPRRPVLAGICLGFLSLKPQLGLLFPLALICARQWRCFIAAAATAVILLGITAFVYGISVWPDYLRMVAPVQTDIMTQGSGLFVFMMPTAFANVRILGFPASLAFLIQAPFTLLAIAAVIWTFIRKRDPAISVAVLISAIFVGTPYCFDYDMVVMGWVIASLKDQLTDPWDIRLMLTVWWLPVLCIIFGLLRLPLAAPLMAIFLLRQLWHLKQMPSQSWRPGPRPADQNRALKAETAALGPSL